MDKNMNQNQDKHTPEWENQDRIIKETVDAWTKYCDALKEYKDNNFTRDEVKTLMGIVHDSAQKEINDLLAKVSQLEKDLKEFEPIPCEYCNGSGMKLGYENVILDCKHCKGSGQQPLKIVVDLEAKVSEQENEIHKLKIELKDTREYWVAQTKNQLNRYEEVHALWTKQKAKISEQEKEIATLMKQIENMKTPFMKGYELGLKDKIERLEKKLSEQSQRIESLTNLLRETAMRGHFAMPENDQDVEWFEEKRSNADFVEQIFTVLKLGKVKLP